MPSERVSADAGATMLLVWRPGPWRDATVRLLQDMGFLDVRCADGAVAAFSFLARTRPRLVLVEADLRPTPGLIFLRELRATAVASRDAPAVIVAQKATAGLAARAAGADGVIFGSPNVAAIQFWLACTEDKVRHVIEACDYHGPDRRVVGLSGLAMEPERRRAQVCANILAAIKADPVMTLLAEAQEKVRRWSETGDDSLLAQALEAVSAAVEAARTARQALLAETLLVAKHRMDDEARTWDADPQAIAGALSVMRDFAYRRLTSGRFEGQSLLQ